MPSLKDTKRRISSVKNTQKITRAMKLVSSAKYARANLALLHSRPYFNSFLGLLAEVSANLELSVPLLQGKKKVKKRHIIVLATDRGLCGPLNSNLFKPVSDFLNKGKEEGFEDTLELWGKRAVMFGETRSEPVHSTHEKILEKPSDAFAKRTFLRLQSSFLKEEVDQVYLAYSTFKTALSQPPVIKRFLPLSGLLEGQKPAEKVTLSLSQAQKRWFSPFAKAWLFSSLPYNS